MLYNGVRNGNRYSIVFFFSRHLYSHTKYSSSAGTSSHTFTLPLCQYVTGSYFHAFAWRHKGQGAQSHGFLGWTGNGDAGSAHRSAAASHAQNGNGSGRDKGGSLVSLLLSNISVRREWRNPGLVVRGPGIRLLDWRNTSAVFPHCYRFLWKRDEPQERRLALRQ